MSVSCGIRSRERVGDADEQRVEALLGEDLVEDVGKPPVGLDELGRRIGQRGIFRHQPEMRGWPHNHLPSIVGDVGAGIPRVREPRSGTKDGSKPHDAQRSASSVRHNPTKEATDMPKVSRDSATQGGDFGPVVDRSDELEDYAVNFTTFREDIDATPAAQGAPGRPLPVPALGLRRQRAR